MRISIRILVGLIAGLSLVAAGCGDDDTDAAGGPDPDLPTVVVTTNILGDVVENVVGDALNVVTIMPVGADPHDFRASAQEAAQIGDADALVVNGGAFEEGLIDVIEAAEGDGVPVFEALSAVTTIEFGEGGHDHDDHSDEDHADEDHSDEDHADEDHADEDHADEDHSDEDHSDEDHSDEDHSDEDHSDEDHHDHDHDGADPHFWSDPARMAVAADAIADFLIDTVDGVDADAVRTSASAFVAELESVDAEVVQTLAVIGDDDRVLVTNHDSFGYFADRYDFEVAGTVIPSGSTTDGASAQELAELVEVIKDEGVPAIFSESTVSDELAQTITSEVGGDIEIVELYTGSLGESGSGAETYVGMVRTNAQRIADALTG
jgi:ABC-type Zn uptake system ZnuABC Zn-binding protein ZnuA